MSKATQALTSKFNYFTVPNGFVGVRQGDCYMGSGSAAQQPENQYTMKTGYLIDMDGLIYRENQLIPGAQDFVEALAAFLLSRKAQRLYVSSRPPETGRPGDGKHRYLCNDR